jgi:HAE1 family hydrophobic/amphiphilic exporter-1
MSEPAAADSETLAQRDANLVARLKSMDRFRFTVTRPVAVLVVFFAVMVFGLFSAQMLPLNLMPEISYPKLTVRTEYAGAAPAEVENDVARPLEEALGVVAGVTRISSISRAGYCDVVMEFTWDSDMDDANQDVLEKIDQVKPVLPDEVNQPLILRYDPTLDPVLVLALTGDEEVFKGVDGLKALRRIGDREVRRLLEPVEGVAAVKVKGGLEEEIQVELDEDALRRTGVGIATVISRLQAENVNLAGGSMREGRTRYLIRTVNEFVDLEDLRELVIVSREGRDIKLRHLATVQHGYKDRDVVTHIDGGRAIEIEIYKEADANIVDMAKLVRARLISKVGPRLESSFDAKLAVVSDRSLFIESSISEVLQTALFGGLLAVVVLFFFLRSARATVIVAFAIPISVLITFAPLKLSGVSLNIMSLGGLALGIGMLVDNSIVVLESIHRCREEGDEMIRATIRGVSEVGSAVTASTLTSIAVFFPMVFVEGVAGQMFGDLGLTVVFSLLASLAVALFFIPMLASRQIESQEGDGLSYWGRVRARWTAWTAFAAAAESVRRDRNLLLKLVAIPYVLVRFVLHLAFELVGKLIATLASLLSDLVLGLAGVLARVLGVVLKPVLLVFEKILDGITALYRVLLAWSLNNKVIVLTASAGGLALLLTSATALETELIPEVHQGEFSIEIAAPVGTPIDVTESIVAPLEERLLADVPRLRALVTTVGAERDSADSGDRGEHSAVLDISLLAGGGQARAAEAAAAASMKPKRGTDAMSSASGRGGGWGKGRASEGPADEADPQEADAAAQREAARAAKAASAEARGLNAEEAELAALEVVRELMASQPDLEVNIERPVLFSFKEPIEIEIRGHDLDDLRNATDAVAARLALIPGLKDVKASIKPGNPEVQIDYDRDALARLNLEIRSVAELVRDKVKGQEATKFTRKDRKIPVRVRLADVDDASVEELGGLVVNPGGGRPIPLSAVSEIRRGRGPNEIRRVGQQRVGLVTANVEGIGLGSASTSVVEAVETLELGPGITTAVTGQSQEWETSSASLYLALGLSIFLVYVIMASQFESLIYPLIILLSIPLALVGVVLALGLLQVPVSVVVFLGVIMLAGIVVNNAIVLVDYVNQLKARGHDTREALEIAGTVRLRPILMTTATTVLGLLPMAIGIGDGAEIRQPMAITVIAGLTFSTVLTLIVIPTVYSGVDRLFGRRSERAPRVILHEEISALDDEQLAPEEFSDAGVVATQDETEAPE